MFNDTIASLAAQHSARVLAEALVARLRSEGKPEAAAAVQAMIDSGSGGIILPGPPNPGGHPQ
jgi:hypothetical protein